MSVKIALKRKAKPKAKARANPKAKRAPAAKKKAPIPAPIEGTQELSATQDKPKGGAPKGNQFWRLRSKHGANSKYTPKQLWEACQEYFEYCEAHPLLVTKTVFTKNGPETAVDERPRAFTQQGLCMYLGITATTWQEWRKSEDKAAIIACVDNIMFEQKFTGAAVDVFNHNIIARELGLADKRDVNVTEETHEQRLRRLMQEDAGE